MIINVAEMFVGLASGVMIGSVFISLLIVLGVIQRFIHLTKRNRVGNQIILPIILGVLCGTLISFISKQLFSGRILLGIIGLFQGLFNGAIIAALAETLNVFPLLSKRFRLRKQLFSLLLAIVLGKVVGSLFQWVILVR